MTIELDVSARVLARHDVDPLSVGFVDYWHRLRSRRRSPTRRNVDPLELSPWIGRIHLWEQLADGDFRCRIWATRTTETTGTIRDGTRASAFWPSPYGATVLEHYQRTTACAEPTIHRVKFTFRGESWTYDRVALPLARSSDTPPMLLNYTVLGDPRPWERLRAALDQIAEGRWARNATIKTWSPGSRHRSLTRAPSAERRLTGRMLRYWEGMATGRRFPTMASLDPRLLGDDWDRCVLVKVEPGLWRSRFLAVGERLSPAPDQHLVGLPISACPPSSVLGALVKHLWRLQSDPQPMTIEGIGDHLDRAVLFRGVLMPMSEDGSKMDTVLGAADYCDPGRS